MERHTLRDQPWDGHGDDFPWLDPSTGCPDAAAGLTTMVSNREIRMRFKITLALAIALLVTGLALAVVGAQQPKPVQVSVFKTATCGCCSIWVEHLRANGFQVDAQNLEQDKLTAISRQAGVTSELGSCHTAKVGNYVVEGHVPAADIQRLLKEKPAIAGIAAPGMPAGSPGMEAGGRGNASRRDRVHQGGQEEHLRIAQVALQRSVVCVCRYTTRS